MVVRCCRMGGGGGCSGPDPLEVLVLVVVQWSSYAVRWGVVSGGSGPGVVECGVVWRGEAAQI